MKPYHITSRHMSVSVLHSHDTSIWYECVPVHSYEKGHMPYLEKDWSCCSLFEGVPLSEAPSDLWEKKVSLVRGEKHKQLSVCLFVRAGCSKNVKTIISG